MQGMELFVAKVDLREAIPIGFDPKAFLPRNFYNLINELLNVHI
jgi:hypothetical protein